MTKDPGTGTPGQDGNIEGDGGNSTNAGQNSGNKAETREEGTQAGVDVENKSAGISEDEWEV